jgi:hypothetical protein
LNSTGMASFGSVYDSQRFIGGAERARREEQKKRSRPVKSLSSNGKGKGKGNGKGNGKKQKHTSHVHGRLPKSLSPNERFCASLLTSSVEELRGSNATSQQRDALMQQVCGRVGVALPQALPSNYSCAREYYDLRTALVLEEARFTLSETLGRRKHKTSIPVTLASVDERKKTGHCVLQFGKHYGDRYKNLSPAFTPQELYYMRPGNCFQVDFVYGGGNKDNNDINNNLSGSVLASIVPQFQHDSSQAPTVTLMVYQSEALPPKIDHHVDDPSISWTISPLGSLISHVRQFEACTRATKVAFLPSILSHKQSTHIRFDDSDDSDDGDEPEEPKEGKEPENDISTSTNNTPISVSPSATATATASPTTSTTPGETQTPKESCETQAPRVITPTSTLSKLNATQQKAAKRFLESAESTLTLVQGPPGTGKTTFLSSVIYENWICERRMLVSAPTNKAISVVCSRFLQLLEQQQSDDDHYCSVVMIGVEDKLVASEKDGKTDDVFSLSSLEASVRRCFVYTWVKSLVQDLESLYRHLGTIREELDHTTRMQTRQLKYKLISSIPSLASQSGARNSAMACVDALDQNKDIVGARQALRQWITEMGSIDPSAATSELLATAHVIFCTLSTAGVSVMKQTRRIDDLLVDEAAAATEPELCIPFHLQPTRLLAVGDPLQLPALVVSPHAMQLGLAKSLQQRLMLDCGDKEHVMLNVQYRMKPDISSFPARHFYKERLTDGPNVMRPEHQSIVSILKGAPAYSFLQVDGPEKKQDGGSHSNPQEAQAVVTLVHMIRNAASSNSSTRLGEPWYDSDRLRIITFYQGQVALIKQLLSRAGLGQVLVATVDSSQGCEADIVLVSFVRSNPGYGTVRRSAGFLADDRRINVAMTRARYQLVCVGDAKGTLSQSGAVTLASIVRDAQDRGCVTSAKDVLVVHKPPPPKRRLPDNDIQQLQSKEKLLNLHKKIAASAKASSRDKKQSLQISTSLLNEIHAMKKQRLDDMKKITM